MRVSLLLLVGCVLLLGESGAAEAAPRTDAEAWADCYARFEKAFEGQNAAGVVACMAPRGRLKVDLHARNMTSGSDGWAKDQAKSSLEAYFKLLASGAKLTVKRAANVAISSVERFDYKYRFLGGDELHTRISVTLAKVEQRWVLVGIRETRRPAEPERGR